MHQAWPLTPGRHPRLTAAPTALERYAHATPRPLYCLAFLLPLVLVYEIGVRVAATESRPPRALVAQNLLHDLLGWIGASGAWLPSVALVATLVVWQVRSAARWRLRPRFVLGMAGESIVLAIPLLVLRQVLLQIGAGSGDLGMNLLLGLGAGLYEELVFRFYVVAALTALVVGVAGATPRWALPIVVTIDALIFAAAHFQPIGAEEWAWASFVARTLGGAYLALVYIRRGLGIAAGCHATHNLLGVLL